MAGTVCSSFLILLKKQPKSHPSKEEMELWLKQQKIAQLYTQTRRWSYRHLYADQAVVPDAAGPDRLHQQAGEVGDEVHPRGDRFGV